MKAPAHTKYLTIDRDCYATHVECQRRDRAEVKRLRALLHKYARHTITCDLTERGSANGGKCNCGWMAEYDALCGVNT